MSAADLASLNLWESIADWGTWLVIIGVAGEGVEIALKILEHKVKNEQFLRWCERHEFSIDIWGGVFWILVVIGLAMEFDGNHNSQLITGRENVRLNTLADASNDRAGEAIKQAAQANERAANTESNNLVMEKAVRELAHLYDQSTNALAEANARLASVRPLKARLTEWFNQINPSILQRLKSGETSFKLSRVPESRFFKLQYMLEEPGATGFCESLGNASEVISGTEGIIIDADVVLKPALAQ